MATTRKDTHNLSSTAEVQAAENEALAAQPRYDSAEAEEEKDYVALADDENVEDVSDDEDE